MILECGGMTYERWLETQQFLAMQGDADAKARVDTAMRIKLDRLTRISQGLSPGKCDRPAPVPPTSEEIEQACSTTV